MRNQSKQLICYKAGGNTSSVHEIGSKHDIFAFITGIGRRRYKIHKDLFRWISSNTLVVKIWVPWNIQTQWFWSVVRGSTGTTAVSCTTTCDLSAHSTKIVGCGLEWLAHFMLSRHFDVVFSSQEPHFLHAIQLEWTDFMKGCCKPLTSDIQ